MPVVSTKKYHVYLLANRKNGTIYLGMTGELKHRIKAHKEEKYKKAFSKRYQTKKLVYYEEHQWVQDVQAREKKLKKWKRQWKIDLIEKENPEWLDLAEAW